MLKLILLPNILIVTVLSAPVADIIRSRPDLSRTAAIITRNPTWTGPGLKTVFVVSDSALAAAATRGVQLNPDKLGSFTMTGTLDFRTSQNYRIVTDVDNVNRMVYDNYAGGQPTPEIHCRYGTGEAIATAWIPADDGYVYVLNGPIIPPQAPLLTMRAHSFNPTGQFANFIESVGMAEAINSLTGVTILTPVDAFFSRAAAQIDRLTTEQRRALIWNHVISSDVHYSTALEPRQYPTRNGNERITVTFNGEANLWNGFAVMPADDMSTAGVHHRLEGVIIPSSFSNGGTSADTRPTTTAGSGATTTGGAPRASTTVSARASASPKPGVSGAQQAAPFFYFGIACMTLLYLAL